MCAEKCPYCGGELEKGKLISRGGNFFLPDGEKNARPVYRKINE